MSAKQKSPQMIQNGPLAVLESRQRQTMSKIPAYGRVTLLMASFGFVATIFIRLLNNILNHKPIEFSLSLGSIISLTLTLCANVIIWLFVIWSLTAIPYIVFHAYKSSQDVSTDIVIKPFKWLQLFASNFLPMIIFAIVWISFATNENVDIVARVNLNELAYIVLGASLVVIILWIINWLIKPKWAEMRLSLMSSLLYASLFLTYGWGYSVVSYSMVFGMLFFLAFGGTSSIAETLRRVAIYDIDPKTAEKLELLTGRYQALKATEDEALLREHEQNAQVLESQQQLRVAKLKGETNLNQQLSRVREKKIDLSQRVNEAQIQILEQKIQMLGRMFDIMAGELNTRMANEMQTVLKQLEQKAKDYSPDEFSERMTSLISKMDRSLQGIPESLEGLRTQLLETAKAIEDQTKLLAAESQKNEDINIS